MAANPAGTAIKNFNQRQRDFAAYYVQHGNGTQAAVDAGYSRKTAAAQASRLLKNVNVKNEISRLHREKHMGADEVLAGLADIARLDMADFIRIKKGGGAQLDLIKAKRAGQLGLVKEIKTKTLLKEEDEDDQSIEVMETSVKLYDKQRALETIANHHGLLKHTEINISINIHMELITRTWSALEEAGLDPVLTFNEMIRLARDRNTET